MPPIPPTPPSQRATPPSETSPSKATRIERAVMALWAMLVIGGFLALGAYSHQAGPATNPPLRWSASAPSGQLLVFAHPQCPCTRATIEILDQLTTHHDTSGIGIEIYFFEPVGAEPDFVRTGSFERATRLSGVNVHIDSGGAMALAADARTSGAMRFYDSEGALRFQGGLTPSRGHVGDSSALANLKALLKGEGEQHFVSPVFGCPLTQEI